LSISPGYYRLPEPTQSSSKGKIIIAAVILGTIAIGYIIASPFLALYHLQNSIAKKDAEGIRECVNFPALRESVKEQIGGLMTRQMAAEPQNGFAALGGMFANAMADRMVDSMVTPQLFINASQGDQANDKGPLSAFANDAVNPNFHFNFDSTDRMTVTFDVATSPKLIWRRTGLTTWMLTSIVLPIPEK